MCEGRVAIVTGAAGNGMGRSIALTLAREGAAVAVNYLKSEESASTIVEHLKEQGGKAVAVRADVTTSEGCQGLVQRTLDDFGRIDICVVNPGGEWRPGPIQGISADESIDDVTRELAPLFHLMPLVLPQMYKQDWGRLIGLSMAQDEKVTPGHGFSYCVGKAARTDALRMMSGQAWEHGVTVNVIAPGPVSPIQTFEEAIEQCAHGPAWINRENVSPQDIAEGVVFLCREAARYITGGELPYRFNA